MRRQALLLMLGVTGCTELESRNDTYANTVGPQTLGPGASDWSCLSSGAVAATTDLNGPLDLRIAVRDFVTGVAPINQRIRACQRADVACMRPATEWLMPDAGGVVVLPLEEGFHGYLEIAGDNVVSTLYALPAELTPDLAETLEMIPLALLPRDALTALGQATQVAFEPDAGVVAIGTFDCAGRAARGVRLELDQDGVPFAIVDGLPIAGRDTTTNDATAGFFNVQPGLVVVEGYRTDTIALVGLSTVLVRPAWVTLSSLMPQFGSAL